MGNNLLRKLALFGGAVVAGSTVIYPMRFTAWKDNHDILLPILVLAGLGLAYCIGRITEFILRRVK